MKKYIITAICAIAACATVATVNATQNNISIHPDHTICQQQNQGVIICSSCLGKGNICGQVCLRCKGRGILRSNGMPLARDSRSN